MTTRLTLGLSTCPNDTYLAHGLLSGQVRSDELELEIVLGDVQELNERLLSGELAASKGSFHLALRETATLGVLPIGSALGFGVGPLLLGGRGPRQTPPRVLSPGRDTTAELLWKLFHGTEPARLGRCIFSDVMPALQDGRADLGICIHEGRFTYEEAGLDLVEDLGERYEREVGEALPLGGLFVRHEIDDRLVTATCELLRQSLACARAQPERALETMRRHAQELEDDVIWKHVELYVNAWTADLGAAGTAALEALDRAARTRGALPSDRPPLRIRQG